MTTKSDATDIRGIVFDKDGTLFDYQKTWVAWCDAVLHDLSDGDPALKSRLAEVCGYDLENQRFVVGSLIVNASAGEINGTWAKELPTKDVGAVSDVAVRHLDNLPNYPVCDLNEVFTDLRDKGYRLGVATNDYEAGAVLQLQDAGVAGYFDFVCGFDTGHGAKPGPGMILGFCKENGLHPHQVAMVGDSTHDLQAGRAAGVGLNIGVLTGPALAEDIDHLADVVLADISALPATFGKIG